MRRWLADQGARGSAAGRPPPRGTARRSRASSGGPRRSRHPPFHRRWLPVRHRALRIRVRGREDRRDAVVREPVVAVQPTRITSSADVGDAADAGTTFASAQRRSGATTTSKRASPGAARAPPRRPVRERRPRTRQRKSPPRCARIDGRSVRSSAPRRGRARRPEARHGRRRRARAARNAAGFMARGNRRGSGDRDVLAQVDVLDRVEELDALLHAASGTPCGREIRPMPPARLLITAVVHGVARDRSCPTRRRS